MMRELKDTCHSETGGALEARSAARNPQPQGAATHPLRFQEGDSSPRYTASRFRRFGMTGWAIAASSLAAFVTPSASAQDIVIRDATILTVSHGRIEHGSIVAHAGKIAAVGTNDQVTAPADAQVIDAAGTARSAGPSSTKA